MFVQHFCIPFGCWCDARWSQTAVAFDARLARCSCFGRPTWSLVTHCMLRSWHTRRLSRWRGTVGWQKDILASLLSQNLSQSPEKCRDVSWFSHFYLCIFSNRFWESGSFFTFHTLADRVAGKKCSTCLFWLEQKILKQFRLLDIHNLPTQGIKSDWTESSRDVNWIQLVCAGQFAGISKLFGCSKTICGFLGKLEVFFTEDI